MRKIPTTAKTKGHPDKGAKKTKPKIAASSRPGKRVGASTYDVGFGKPPVAHRFRKGQSGNPAGRPKRSPYKRARLRQALLERLDGQVTVVAADGEHRFP